MDKYTVCKFDKVKEFVGMPWCQWDFFNKDETYDYPGMCCTVGVGRTEQSCLALECRVGSNVCWPFSSVEPGIPVTWGILAHALEILWTSFAWVMLPSDLSSLNIMMELTMISKTKTRAPVLQGLPYKCQSFSNEEKGQSSREWDWGRGNRNKHMRGRVCHIIGMKSSYPIAFGTIIMWEINQIREKGSDSPHSYSDFSPWTTGHIATDWSCWNRELKSHPFLCNLNYEFASWKEVRQSKFIYL